MNDNLTLVDTDILIFILKNQPEAIRQSQKYQEEYGKLKISEITYYECLRGFKTSNSLRKLSLFETLTTQMEVFPLNRKIYGKASEVYVLLRKKGFPTGEFDLLIAATALVNNLRLSTNNTKDFRKISEYFNLKLDNWSK